MPAKRKTTDVAAAAQPKKSKIVATVDIGTDFSVRIERWYDAEISESAERSCGSVQKG
jgi:hypothetical protein